jgi:tetratricopeptide (TPR) repeat protein
MSRSLFPACILVALAVLGTPARGTEPDPIVGQWMILKQPGVTAVKDFKQEHPQVVERVAGLAYMIVDAQGDWVWIHTDKGMGWVHRGDVFTPQVAIPYFSDRIYKDVTDADAWARRGMARLWTLEPDDALHDLSEAIRLQPKVAEWYHKRALFWQLRGDSAKVMADLVEAARLEPTSGQLVSDQATLWHLQGNKAKFEEFVHEALRLDPGCADAYCHRAMIWEERKDFERALADYARALELHPGHAEARNNRTLLLYNLGRFDDAIVDATIAIRYSANAHQAYRIRGVAYLRKGDADKALPDLNESLRLMPRHFAALVARSEAFRKKRENAKAISDLEEALSLQPRNAMLCQMLGAIYKEQRDWTRALKWYQEGVSRDPAESHAQNALARLRATCPDAAIRDGKQAVEAAKRACDATAWKIPVTLDTLAAAYAESGNFEEAIRWERAALENADFAASAGANARQRLQLYESHQAYHEQ